MDGEATVCQTLDEKERSFVARLASQGKEVPWEGRVPLPSW